MNSWQPTPVFLPGESHGHRSLAGYSPRGRKESDTAEWLHFHFLSIGQSFLVFVYLWPIISFFFPRTLPNIYMYFLLRWIPPQRTMDAGPHLLWGGIPSLFNPQGAFRCMCGEGSFPDLRSGHLIPSLQQSSDSATSFVLGVSGWIQSLNFSPLDKHQLSSPGAHLSLTSDSLGS